MRQDWHANKVDYEDGPSAGIKPIQFPMSQMKPLGAQSYRVTSACPDTIVMVLKV